MKNKKNSSIVESFDSAFKGLLYVFKRERNFKIHIFVGIIAILLSLFFHIPLTETLIIIVFISLVFVSEIINTTIEILSENIDEGKYNIIKTVKDISASSVLISSIFAFIGGYLIFIKFFPIGFRNIFENIARSPWYFTFFILMIVLLLTVILKVLTGKSFSLVGGMPSIHSGIAFSIWTAISFLTFKEHPVISPLVFLLAFWVAQSRITKKIHTIEEVIIGGVIGVFVTILLFQILWR
ncbi:MAG: diacylglycerol kinase [Candidatus Omnitrophica bacterium]|nr:diacylglycerol kinase [Candidatus Omnitrophota bacterium]MCM8809335.1 diacylglycerol kinase [Candidatus Omnitrophota bacterium]